MKEPILRTKKEIWKDLREDNTKPWPNLAKIEYIEIDERDTLISFLREKIKEYETKNNK